MDKIVKLYIEKLDALSTKAFYAADKHRKAGREKGLAFYHFGRNVSCFMSVKTLLFSMGIVDSHEFAEKYIEGLPNPLPKNLDTAKRYMKETHSAIRFILFQNIYSQNEFTYRIIQREKFPAWKKNIFEHIASEYGIMSDNMPKFLGLIRNTIHNNGHYFPLFDKLDYKHPFGGKEFKFNYGKPFKDITMDDILAIIDYMLDENITLFEKNEELAKIEFNN